MITFTRIDTTGNMEPVVEKFADEDSLAETGTYQAHLADILRRGSNINITVQSDEYGYIDVVTKSE